MTLAGHDEIIIEPLDKAAKRKKSQQMMRSRALDAHLFDFRGTAG